MSKENITKILLIIKLLQSTLPITKIISEEKKYLISIENNISYEL